MFHNLAFTAFFLALAYLSCPMPMHLATEFMPLAYCFVSCLLFKGPILSIGLCTMNVIPHRVATKEVPL